MLCQTREVLLVMIWLWAVQVFLEVPANLKLNHTYH